jgi:hypothetical protein
MKGWTGPRVFNTKSTEDTEKKERKTGLKTGHYRPRSGLRLGKLGRSMLRPYKKSSDGFGTTTENHGG